MSIVSKKPDIVSLIEQSYFVSQFSIF